MERQQLFLTYNVVYLSTTRSELYTARDLCRLAYNYDGKAARGRYRLLGPKGARKR